MADGKRAAVTTEAETSPPHKRVDAGISAGEELWKECIRVPCDVRHIADLLASGQIGADHRTPLGMTPLHLAAGRTNVEAVRALLEHGPWLDERDAEGKTALHVALDTNVYFEWMANETLHMAGEARRSEVVGMLLAKGADANAACAFGRTVLHRAARGGNPEIVRMLVRAGARIDARDRGNETPLRYARRFGALAAADILIRAGTTLAN